MGIGIKPAKVHARADRKAVNDFSVRGIHHHHLRLVMATDKEALCLGIVSETCRSLRHANGKTLLYFQRLWAEDDNLVSVFDVDIDQTIASDDRLRADA